MEEKGLEGFYWKNESLLKAALSGEWKSAEDIIKRDALKALKRGMTKNEETILHVAVTIGKKSIDFVEQLVKSIPEPTATVLEVPDGAGYTVLHSAARFGNTKAARILVNKHPALLYICNEKEHYWLPIHQAAASGHKGTLSYLLDETKHRHPDLNASGRRGGVGFLRAPFAGQSGAELLVLVIASGFYDVALELVGDYPEMATTPLDNKLCALGEMVKQVSAFKSCNRLNFWRNFIYCLPVKNYVEDHRHNGSDLESQNNNSQEAHNQAQLLRNFSISVRRNVQAMSWRVFELLVLLFFKDIREQNLMHHQALQLVKCLCRQIKSLKDLKSYRSFVEGPFLEAASLGICEIVEEVLDLFPIAMGATSNNRNIFQLAVINRQENIFNLLRQMGGYKQSMIQFVDGDGNNILHLAGKLAPPNKLNLVPGAALQMQRELQWFKEVEKFVTARDIEGLNKAGKTPAMVFSEEHKELVKGGEQWMRDTANSCTIVAALVVTIVFAAAITVPGGNNGTSGIPMFSKEIAFIIFVVSDAISLFTSAISLLTFLSILTSHYTEGDFFHLLPRRLIIGLLTLFFSITTMMIAFSSTLYLVFSHRKEWILIPVAAFTFLPITSFVSLQFPLFVNLISSTYGRGIFRKH